MSSSNNLEVVKDLVVESCLGMFSTYEVELTYKEDTTLADAQDQDLVLAGIIGFTADEMRGTMVLAATETPLRRSTSETTHRRDWIAELANQLLGRMKNRLVPYGVDLVMTTPLSLRGNHLVMEPSDAELKPHLFYSDDGGSVCVWFDAEFEPGVELTKSEDPDAQCPDEGELLLF